MFSAPPATATSASPSMIAWAAVMIACRPLPHRRFSVRAGDLDRQAALDARNPRQVMVVRVGVDDVAEDDVADLARLDAGAADGLAHADRRQIAGRNVLQTAAVAADRRPHAAQNHDFTGAAHLISPEWFAGAPRAGDGAIATSIPTGRIPPEKGRARLHFPARRPRRGPRRRAAAGSRPGVRVCGFGPLCAEPAHNRTAVAPVIRLFDLRKSVNLSPDGSFPRLLAEAPPRFGPAESGAGMAIANGLERIPGVAPAPAAASDPVPYNPRTEGGRIRPPLARGRGQNEIRGRKRHVSCGTRERPGRRDRPIAPGNRRLRPYRPDRRRGGLADGPLLPSRRARLRAAGPRLPGL